MVHFWFMRIPTKNTLFWSQSRVHQIPSGVQTGLFTLGIIRVMGFCGSGGWMVSQQRSNHYSNYDFFLNDTVYYKKNRYQDTWMEFYTMFQGVRWGCFPLALPTLCLSSKMVRLPWFPTEFYVSEDMFEKGKVHSYSLSKHLCSGFHTNIKYNPVWRRGTSPSQQSLKWEPNVHSHAVHSCCGILVYTPGLCTAANSRCRKLNQQYFNRQLLHHRKHHNTNIKWMDALSVKIKVTADLLYMHFYIKDILCHSAAGPYTMPETIHLHSLCSLYAIL